MVSLHFSADGSAEFQQMTRELAGYPVGDAHRRFAIVLDGVVQVAPQLAEDVNPEIGIPGGRGIIYMGTGGDPEQAAAGLTVILRYGALPVALTVVDIVESGS